MGLLIVAVCLAVNFPCGICPVAFCPTPGWFWSTVAKGRYSQSYAYCVSGEAAII